MNFDLLHIINVGIMKRMEDQYKITILSSYKMLFNHEFEREELYAHEKFEMHDMLENEIENVVERMLFENTYEIFPN